MTRREMLSKMDSMELSEWVAFFIIKAEEKVEKPDTDQESLEVGIKNEFDMYNRGVK